MTRTHTQRPIWVWKCDSCGKEQGLATEQNHLPGAEVMRAAGWFIAEQWGDKCPECVKGRGNAARE